MSSSSKYSGLAGTLLLGSLLGLNYTQYAKRKYPLADKGAAYNPEDEISSGAFFDKDGRVVPLGKTELPGANFIRRAREYVPSCSPLVLCGALSGLWGIRAFAAMNRVLNRRYSDVVYQIRRPDVIRNRIVAWRVLGGGGLVVPGILVSWVLYMKNDLGGTMSEGISEIRSTLSPWESVFRSLAVLSPIHVDRSSEIGTSIAEFGRTLQDGLRPPM